MKPAVTIAIPFFNEAQHLGAAVRSVLAQTMRDFELLLVDDGSTDGSLDVARSFQNDARVAVLCDGQRRHLPARLNEVVRRARAPLVARMDADDLSHPSRLEKQLAALARKPEVSAVGTWIALLDAREQVFCVTEAGRASTTPARALEHGNLAHATLVARREWHLANPYDEALTRIEDRDLWYRTAATTRFDVVPEVLYAVRIDTESTAFGARYSESQRQTRMLLRRHGPHALGWRRTTRAVALNLAKTAIVRTASRLGLADTFVRRRGRTPSDEDRRRVDETLAAAQ